jgi:hypothetical protein
MQLHLGRRTEFTIASERSDAIEQAAELKQRYLDPVAISQHQPTIASIARLDLWI